MQATKPTIRTAIRHTWLDTLDWFDRQNANLIGLLITALLSAGLVGTIVQLRTAPAAEMPKPIIIIATAPAVAYPTAIPQAVAFQQQPAQPVAPRMVVAFASPDGDILGPIVAPELGAIVARFGDNWVATMHQGAMVWIRLGELGASLTNVAPAPQLQPAYAPPPAPAYAPEQTYQQDNTPQAPEPAPAPVQPPVAAPVVAAPAPQVEPVNPDHFYEQTPAQREWNRVQSCMEHPEWNCQ